MATVRIDLDVALQEERELSEHYRNRNLILAQAVADLLRENAELKNRISQLENEAKEGVS